MARIAFFPFAEIGHTNATFGLARRLRARGHDVIYLSLADVQDHVRAQGWEFIPFFEDVFPKGYLDAKYAMLRTRKAPLKELYTAASELNRRARAQFTEVISGDGFAARLADLRPDAMLIDAVYPLPALTARRLGIPAAIFSTTLPLGRDSAVPPLSTRIIPDAGRWSALKTRAIWTWLDLRGRIGYVGFTRDKIEELGARHPELGALCDFGTHLQHGPRLKIPTLVASCQSLDFRRASLDHLHYIGPCIDLERAEPALPPELEIDDRPLIYCALGTREEHAPRCRPFFQALLDAMSRRPHQRLLLVVGKPLSVADFRVPSNAVVVNSVPQLKVLRKAALMINHGGLNSVKECICLGVPMIAFPLAHDQPGNAARIAHHGLGLAGDLGAATPGSLGAMIDTVLTDPGYRDRVRAMQRDFLSENDSDRGPELIERMVSQRPRASA
jgi:UDP:flavonoid glycosyltransferase YjiC (YdhE family)